MTKPLRIKPKGSESTYILESAMPSSKGERVKYGGETYVKEELPPEFVMLEGVAYKRGMRVADYNRKAMMEGVSGIKLPSKIKLKGTNIVLEATNERNNVELESIGFGYSAYDDQMTNLDMFARCVYEAIKNPNIVILMDRGEALETRDMPNRIFRMAEGFEKAKTLEFEDTHTKWVKSGNGWSRVIGGNDVSGNA